MAMNSSIPSSFIFSTKLALFITLLHLFSPSSCFSSSSKHPPDSTRGLLFGDKSRLGSTPPSCHNKCNQCHPCMAVQVTTPPSHSRVQPHLSRPAITPLDYNDPSAGKKYYSNYKPLGWKCRCNNHFYNP